VAALVAYVRSFVGSRHPRRMPLRLVSAAISWRWMWTANNSSVCKVR
jgi:hypothetical protein